MNKTINKNFSFLLNEDVNFNCKEQIMIIINTIHERINKKDFSDTLFNLRKILEKALTEYLDKKGHDTSSLNLSSLINLFKENYGSSFNSIIIDSFYNIKKWGNYEVHKRTDKVMLAEIIVALKNTREIILYLFFNNEKQEEFDEFLYYKNTNQKSDDIRIIKSDNENNQIYNNDIEVHKTQLGKWMTIENNILQIPIYQRGYSWDEEQIEILFNDIKSRYNDNSVHYFGNIAGKIIVPKNYNPTNNKKINVKIIDGQQRLTTSFLFISAVRDILKENGSNIENETLINDILRKDIKNYFVNPGGTALNNEVFRKILTGDLLNINKNNKYFINYLKFKNLIIQENFDNKSLREFANIFITKFELVTISFNDEKISNKKEMEIFENLNSKGKELAMSDLIKNYIFNLCSEELLQNEKYETEIPILYNSYILNELSSPSSIIDVIEEFYRSLIEYNTGQEISKNRQTQFNNFKDTINTLFELDKQNEFKTIFEYEEFLKKINIYAILFNDLMNNNGEIYGKILSIDIIIKLCGDKKKIKLFVGLLFLIIDILRNNFPFDDHENLKDFLKRIITSKLKKEIFNLFLFLMKAITKNSIVTGQGDSSFRRNITESIFYIRKELFYNKNNKDIKISDLLEMFKNETKKFINTDEDFKVKLLNNNEGRKAIAWLLILTEWEMADFINGGQIINYNKPTLEHIMPKEKKEWIKQINEEYNWEERFPFMLNKIGNYFIINKPKNSSASNYSFLKKKEIYKENSSPLYKNNNTYIDIYNKQEWTFDIIEKRTTALVDYICEKVIKHNN
ncbi:MAG: DUF262 domain-containing protein [Metamycoplasmataceae bacterium]